MYGWSSSETRASPPPPQLGQRISNTNRSRAAIPVLCARRAIRTSARLRVGRSFELCSSLDRALRTRPGQMGDSGLFQPASALSYIMVWFAGSSYPDRWPISFSGARRPASTSSTKRMMTQIFPRTNMSGSCAPPAPTCICSTERPASYWAEMTSNAASRMLFR